MATADKKENCGTCGKVVYPTERLAADEQIFHKGCFRCKKCNNVMKLGSFASMNGVFFCKPCFKKNFFSKGNYSSGFGKLTPQQEHDQKSGKDSNGFVPLAFGTPSSPPQKEFPKTVVQDLASPLNKPLVTIPSRTSMISVPLQKKEESKPVKKEEVKSPVEIKKPEPKKEEPKPVVVEIKKEEKKSVVEVKKEEPKPVVEVKKEEPKPVVEIKKEEIKSVVVEVKKEEVEIKVEVKKEEVKVIAEVKKEEIKVEVKKEEVKVMESIKKPEKTATPATKKSNQCQVCQKVVYPMEEIKANDGVFHKGCFRCKNCNSVLVLGSFASMEGQLFCKPCFKKAFFSKGDYASGFGKMTPQQEHDNKTGTQAKGYVGSFAGVDVVRKSASVAPTPNNTPTKTPVKVEEEPSKISSMEEVLPEETPMEIEVKDN